MTALFLYLQSLSTILHKLAVRVVRSIVAEFKLSTSINSTTNTCSFASLILSSMIRTGALTSESLMSSGSKITVIFVLLKSLQSEEHSMIITSLELIQPNFPYLQRVENEYYQQVYLVEGEEMWL